jgi:predicted MFS family arabinose efflux permease
VAERPASALRVARFRWFFAGRSIATLGDQISPVALAFAVLSLSRSPTALGLVLAAAVLPEAAFVLLGGVVADRWDRRRLMLVTDLVRLVVQGVAASLLLTHRATVLDLAALQVLYGLATAFFTPATLGFINELVEPDQLQGANSLNSLSYSVASIAGPAIGGLLVALGSPGTALAVDAGTFALSAYALTLVRAAPSRPPEQTTNLLRDLRDGWAEFTRQTWVWVLVGFWGLYQGGVLAGYQVLGPVIAKRHLGGAGAWAAVLTARGVGSVLGGAVGLRLRPRRPMVVACLLLLTDIPLLLLLAASAPVPAIAAAGLAEGGALTYGAVLWITALQQRVPAAAQSRVFAYDQLGSISLLPAGLIVVGLVADHAGAADTLVAIAVLHLLLMLLAVTVRSVRSMTAEPPIAPVATA